MAKLDSRGGDRIDREIGILIGLAVLALFVVLGFWTARKESAPISGPVAVAPAPASAPASAALPGPTAPTGSGGSAGGQQIAQAAPAPAPAPVVAPAPAPVVAPPPVAPAPPPPVAQAPAPAANNAPVDPEQVWRVKVNPEDARKGPEDAPATLVVFTAFGCGTCTPFADAVDRIVAKHGNKLRVIFKHKVIPISPFALEASMAALAAKEQGKFWEYQDKLWKTNAALTGATLEGIATELGLDLARFKKDAASDKLRSQVMRDSLLANEVGAHSMPNALVNGVRMAGEKSYESLEQVVDKELAKAEAKIKAGADPKTLYDTTVATGRFFEQLEPQKFAFANDESPSLGPKDAKVQVTTFEDFECPFCTQVGPMLKEFQARFPNDVRIVFKNFPLTSIHPKAQLASEAAMAAHEQGKFWEYHDLLFANQKVLDRPDLERYAEQLGLDMGKFRAALDSGKWKPFMEREMADGARAQVGGTPSIFLNGQRYQGPRGYPPEGLEAVARTYLGL
ncbi:MAG: hypothetical protein AMXMBFR64_03720 [Myxococcales bacterium]